MRLRPASSIAVVVSLLGSLLVACGSTVENTTSGSGGSDAGSGGASSDGGGTPSSTASTASTAVGPGGAGQVVSSGNATTTVGTTVAQSGSGGVGGSEPCPDETPFACFDGLFCLDNTAVCDEFEDCADGSDELDCGSICDIDEFLCEGDYCIPDSSVCDGSNDCDEGEDESSSLCGCEDDEVACTDGACIPTSFVCDGEPDCEDGIDEDEGIRDGEICDSGITNVDPDFTFCLAVSCCEEFNACNVAPDPGPCLSCLSDGGGALCDAALACAAKHCEG